MVYQFQQIDQQQTFVQQPLPVPGHVAIEHQDSLEDNWEGLVDYLKLTVNSTEGSNSTTVAPGCSSNNDACQDFFLMGDVTNNVALDSSSSGAALPMIEPLTPEVGDISTQQPTDFLIHNVSMPTETMNITSDLGNELS